MYTHVGTFEAPNMAANVLLVCVVLACACVCWVEPPRHSKRTMAGSSVKSGLLADLRQAMAPHTSDSHDDAGVDQVRQASSPTLSYSTTVCFSSNVFATVITKMCAHWSHQTGINLFDQAYFVCVSDVYYRKVALHICWNITREHRLLCVLTGQALSKMNFHTVLPRSRECLGEKIREACSYFGYDLRVALKPYFISEVCLATIQYFQFMVGHNNVTSPLHWLVIARSLYCSRSLCL